MLPLSYVYRPPTAALTPARTPTAVAILLVAFTVSVFVSTALTNIFAALVSIAAIIRWVSDRPWHLLRHPLIMACLAFMAWAVLRDLAAGAGPAQVLATVSNFRVIAYVVLWAPLFQSRQVSQQVMLAALASMAAYAAGATALLLGTGQMPYGSVSPDFELHAAGHKAWQWGVQTLFTRLPDVVGPLFVAAIFGALTHALAYRRWRPWLLAFAALATVALFLATARRTSQLGFVACTVLFLWLHRHHASRRAIALIGIGLALFTAVVSLTPAADGLQRAAAAATRLLQADASNRDDAVSAVSSEGQRLKYWGAATAIIDEHPLAGTSRSAYPDHYRIQAVKFPAGVATHPNPHNEYLYVWGSLGLVGLVLYLAMPAAAWMTVRRTRVRQDVLLYYLVAMLSAIAVNSLVIDMVPGHAHALAWLAIVMSAGGESEEVR